MEMVPRSLRCEEAHVCGRERMTRADDESGFHVAMGRLRARRAPRGERAYGRVPRNRGKNLTLVASMSLSGMGETMVVEGSTDAEAFEVYVEHFLAPALKEGQVVVFDRQPRGPQTSKDKGADRGEGSRGAFPALLLAGPEPIEEAFSKIKGIVRKTGARTHEALFEAIAQALWAITPVDAAGWFAHSGYEVKVQYL